MAPKPTCAVGDGATRLVTVPQTFADASPPRVVILLCVPKNMSIINQAGIRPTCCICIENAHTRRCEHAHNTPTLPTTPIPSLSCNPPPHLSHAQPHPRGVSGRLQCKTVICWSEVVFPTSAVTNVVSGGLAFLAVQMLSSKIAVSPKIPAARHIHQRRTHIQLAFANVLRFSAVHFRVCLHTTVLVHFFAGSQ